MGGRPRCRPTAIPIRCLQSTRGAARVVGTVTSIRRQPCRTHRGAPSRGSPVPARRGPTKSPTGRAPRPGRDPLEAPRAQPPRSRPEGVASARRLSGWLAEGALTTRAAGRFNTGTLVAAFQHRQSVLGPSRPVPPNRDRPAACADDGRNAPDDRERMTIPSQLLSRPSVRVSGAAGDAGDLDPIQPPAPRPLQARLA
jgi:hypothetical protein